jgi:hypothetical protein
VREFQTAASPHRDGLLQIAAGCIDEISVRFRLGFQQVERLMLRIGHKFPALILNHVFSPAHATDLTLLVVSMGHVALLGDR